MENRWQYIKRVWDRQQEHNTHPQQINVLHPSDAKYTTKKVKKWHHVTACTSQWPLEGTFDVECCENLEQEIGQRKAGRKGQKAEASLRDQLMVIGRFSKQGQKWRDRVRVSREAATNEEQKEQEKPEKSHMTVSGAPPSYTTTNPRNPFAAHNQCMVRTSTPDPEDVVGRISLHEAPCEIRVDNND